jgi:hypothetical protein
MGRSFVLVCLIVDHCYQQLSPDHQQNLFALDWLVNSSTDSPENFYPVVTLNVEYLHTAILSAIPYAIIRCANKASSTFDPGVRKPSVVSYIDPSNFIAIAIW